MCCVVNCRSNYTCEEKTTVFSFPKEEHFWNIWIKIFQNRKDWEPTNSSYICIKHFEDKHYQKGEGNERFRLIKTLKLVPTKFDRSNPNLSLPGVSIPRKLPRKRTYQEDHHHSFIAEFVIKSFSDINEIICL